MGTTLTGTTPATTYDSLIKVTDNGPLSGTAKYLSDGLGNDSALALSTGNIGIGTSSPSEKLEVDGNVQIGTTTDAKLYMLSTGGNGNNERFYIEGYADGGTYGGGFKLYTRDDSNIFNNAVTVNRNGNVGIGTSSPSEVLHIKGNQRISALTGASVTAVLDLYGNNSNTYGGSNVVRSRIQSLTAGDAFSSILTFSTNDSSNVLQERVRIDANGLTFNGDTAAANALDDYEEGTFTPTFAGSTTNPTVTYAAQLGRYTKIGRQVTASIELGISANTGGVGTIQVAGLPFTVGIRSYMCVATFNIDNTTATPISIFAEIAAGGTNFALLQTGDNASWANMDWTQATSSVIYVNCTITYFV